MKSTQLNNYDHGQEAHIQPLPEIPPEIFKRLIQFCPAGLYWQDEDGQHYDPANCLECGTCRVIAGEENFKAWNFPDGGKGVDYR